MPLYELQGPDGKIYEIEAPDVQTASGAFEQMAGRVQSAVAAVPEAVNTAADVAKSAGIGVAQGAIGLATLPGNMEAIGRMGVNAGASALGFQPPWSNETYLPNFNDGKKFVEGYTGEFYEPKTTAGEYARTIGEFAPLAALGPGGAAARAANVVAPAVVSETAGQLTKGTEAEPWARAGGALAGGFATNAALRAVTPNPIPAERAAQVARLRAEGVDDLTAGQVTGSKPLRWAESVTQDVPLGGTRATTMANRQAEQFTRAALRRAGVNADRATPEVIDNAFRTIGQRFDELGGMHSARLDSRALRRMNGAIRDYDSLTPPTARVPFVEEIASDLQQIAGNRGFIRGEQYQALRSRLSRASASAKADPQLSSVLGRIRDTLDDAMERRMPPAQRNEWREVRNQYRNLLQIEKAIGGAGENAALGLISPAQLRNASKTQNARRYVRGQDDLGNLARAGEAIMKPLPQSGTAPRAAAQGIMGIGGYAAGAGDLLSGLAAVAAPAASARAVMSRPVQGYLSNQLLAPQIAAQNAARLTPMQRIPQAAMQAVQPPSSALMGGIGPMYDEYGNPLF